MRTVAAIVLMVIAGCASPHWDKPGGTSAAFASDRYACLKDSSQYSGVVMSGWLYDECMKSKGWTLR